MDDARIHTGILLASSLAAPTGWVQRFTAVLKRVLCIQGAAQRRLKRVDTLSFGPRKSVHLIACDGEHFLIADGLSAPVPLCAKADEALDDGA